MKRDYEKEYKDASDRMFQAREIEEIRAFKMPKNDASMLLQCFDCDGETLLDVELTRKQFTIIRRIVLKLKKQRLCQS